MQKLNVAEQRFQRATVSAGFGQGQIDVDVRIRANQSRPGGKHKAFDESRLIARRRVAIARFRERVRAAVTEVRNRHHDHVVR